MPSLLFDSLERPFLANQRTFGWALISVRFTPDTVAKLFPDHWDAILNRAVVPLGKNDSWSRRFRFYRCAKVVVVRVLQQYPLVSGRTAASWRTAEFSQKEPLQ